MEAIRNSEMQLLFPDLVWNHVATKLDPETFSNLCLAQPELRNIIHTTTCVNSLFPAVFQILYGKGYVGFTDAKNCRRVCTKWSSGVDTYFQITNFDTIQNITGVRNGTDITIHLPLRLPDIQRIYEFDSHPRCVSFGKKLTLVVDNCSPHVVPRRKEIKDLLHNIKTVWQHFEHLEVRLNTAYYSSPVLCIRPDYTETCYDVPYGDIGIPNIINMIHVLEENQEAKSNSRHESYSKFKPEELELYIPFLQHMTNLKSVTLLLRDRHHLCQILLRIPRVSNLERIFIGGNLCRMHVSWFKLPSVIYSQCSDNLNFLSGCEMQSLEAILNPAAGKKRKIFEKLTELHVCISSRMDLEALLRLANSDATMGNILPKLSILQVKVAIHMVPANTLKVLYQFALQIPTLQHLSLAGRCIPPDCLNLEQIVGRKRLGDEHCISGRTEDQVNATSIITFQFECPSHIPLTLMRCFPLLKHVIIAEQPRRCRRRQSKCNDWRYIRGFFSLFEPHVRTVTFVPSNYVQLFELLLFQPGAITRSRTDKRFLGRKRKRNTNNDPSLHVA